MADLHLEKDDDLLQVLNKLKETPNGGIRIFLPLGSRLFSNPLNFKLLQKEAARLGKKIAFETDDPQGQKIISGFGEKFGFVEGDIEENVKFQMSNVKTTFVGRLKSLIPAKILQSRKIPLPLAVGSGLFATFILLSLVFFFFPRAKVTLVVDSDLLVKTVDLTASSSATMVDLQNRIIPAALLSVEETGTERAAATGKGLVGEKAKGTATIYNQTDTERSFSRGTKIKKDALEFLLDSGASVDAQTIESTTSAEGKRVVTYTAGKTNVAVTAAEVGDQYNLEAGATFSVADHNVESIYAKNKENFSGGSSREVTIVTADDQKRLEAALTGRLQGEAQNDLSSRLSGDQEIPEGVTEFAVLTKDFDKEAGEEAENFGLTLRVKASALSYARDQFTELLRRLLSDFVPENYQLSEKDQEITLIDAKREEGDLKITAKIKAYVLPKLNLTEIKKNLSGTKLSLAQEFFSTLPNVKSFRIELWPPLPGPLRFLPKRAERIAIEIERQ